MRKGTHGELVNEMMHPQLMQFPLVRLNGLSSSHNPLDGLRVQPLNYVHSWTSPTTIKEKIPYLQGCPVAWSCEHVEHVVSLLSIIEKRGVLSWLPAMLQMVNLKKGGPRHGGQQFNISTATSETWKKAGSSLYLDELPIQKCKFRHRFTVHR